MIEPTPLEPAAAPLELRLFSTVCTAHSSTYRTLNPLILQAPVKELWWQNPERIPFSVCRVSLKREMIISE